jgi:hypothetical protein
LSKKDGSSRLASGRLLSFPCALGALRFWKIAVLNPVIGVAIADCAQRLVIETGGAGGFAQFLRKLMQGLKMIGGGGDFCLGGLEKLLIALIDEAGDFTANLDAGLGKETRMSKP